MTARLAAAIVLMLGAGTAAWCRVRLRTILAIVLMLGAGTAVGAELGRLFFTPAQRATLDTMREKNIGTETAGAKEPAPPLPQNVTLDGVVRRSDGKNTVWLNKRAVNEKQAGGINVSTGKTDNRVKLTVPESGRSIELKVGQTAEIVSGTIAESYARRAPLPKPEAKAAPGAEDAASATAKKAAPGAENAASGAAKPAPGADSTASDTAKVPSPAASPPVASEGAARNPALRTRSRDADDDPRPRRGSETR